MLRNIFLILFSLIHFITFAQKYEHFKPKYPECKLFSGYLMDNPHVINPFKNRNYLLFIYKLKDVPKNDISRFFCVYNMNLNKIEIIDSCNSLLQNREYLGFEGDSLFVYDLKNKKYYKLIYPNKTIIYQIDEIKICLFNKIREKKLIYSESEFAVNSNYDIAYFDGENFGKNFQVHIIKLKNGNYDPDIILNNVVLANEAVISWLSNTEVLYLNGYYNEKEEEFVQSPYIYDLVEKKIKKITCDKEIVGFYDIFKNKVLVSLNEKDLFYKKGTLTKQNNQYIIKIDTIIDYTREKYGQLYSMFFLENNDLIIKAEQLPTNASKLNNFYYTKLIHLY